MRSGLGGKQGSLSGRSVGKQSLIDRAGSKHKLIRAIGGSDIITWIDATSTSNTIGSNLSNSTIDVVQGTSPTIGSQPPSTEFSSVLNTTAYSFQLDENLIYAIQLIPANTDKLTVVSRFCVTGDFGIANIVWELGDLGYAEVDGGAAHGTIDVAGDKFWSGIGDKSASQDSFFLSTLAPTSNTEYVYVTTHDTEATPDSLTQHINGESLTAAEPSALENDADYDFDRTDKAYIGARGTGASLPLNGHISDLFIITRKLTDSEASRLSKALLS